MGASTTLIVCVLGLYGSFLTWLVLQERINTKPYGVDPLGNPVYFKAPLMIGIVQAFFALIIGLGYSLVAKKQNPFAVFTHNERSHALRVFRSFVLIAVTLALSSPLGYQSLKHVDYLAYLLAKSCKLIPVMVVHFLFYRTRFPAYKYAVAGAVTVGVAMFTLNHGSTKESNNDGNTGLGLAYLGALMFLDGLTNSTQDQMFKSQANATTKVSGANLMCLLNLFSCILTLAYAVGFRYQEVTDFIEFCTAYPAVLRNILEFGVLGSVGQVFVFIILEKFDLLILITATVTRKMLSMMLSVVLFGHRLNQGQWLGVGLVFGGIGYEALVKARQAKPEAKKE